MATAADRLRALDGVLDLTQTPQIGKKGRAITLFRVLCRPEAADIVAQACLMQTTTLGVRRADLTRQTLDRAEVAGQVRVKTADRPHATTAKAESDDLTGETLADRRAMARNAETRALDDV